MKSSIVLTSALATAVLALPNPQLLDVGLNLGGRVTVTTTLPAATVTVTKPATTVTTTQAAATVTVTKPAATCLPGPATGVAPAQPSTSKSALPPIISTTLKPLPVTTSSKPAVIVPTWTQTLPQVTSRPVVPVPSSSKPPTTPSTTVAPRPTSQVPSPGNHITGPSQALLSIGIDYQAAILFHHNAARANHGAPPLTWDASCEANARLAANTCNYAPYFPAGVSQGQNLFLSVGNAFNVTAGITETWYKNQFSSAVPLFGLPSLSVTLLPRVGQLTQLLWKGTTKVGCASVDCGTRMKVAGAPSAANKYTVCNYASPGNVAGLFALNVGLPISKVNLGSWTD